MSCRKSLKGIHVAVDAYNLQLEQGTGIKTYSLTLIDALQRLGAETGVLYSRRWARDPRLAEILFFDVANAGEEGDLVYRARRKLSGIAATLKGAARLPVRARLLELGKGEVIRRPELDYILDTVKIFNVPDCYERALRAEKFFGNSLTVRVPERIDVWHATYPLPITIKGAKKITTIHDLVPFRLPYTTLDNKVRLFSRFAREIRKCQLIVTVSESTKRDLFTLFDVDPDKIFVTYQPVSLSPLTSAEECSLEPWLKRRFSLHPGKYLLFVGAIEPKKNVKRLIDAFRDLDTEMPLVIAGKKAWLWEQEVWHLEGLFGKRWYLKVKLLDFVSRDDLRRLYAGACCFVFPSLYEGFGLPPLEAMTFGVPVITSDVSALPEVCGDAALYVDPYDTGSITARMEQVIGNADVWNTLSEAGKARVQMFSMENYTKRLADAYAKIL